MSYLEDRFGIPDKLFDDYLFFRRKKSWVLLRNGPHVISAANLKVSQVGLKAFQKIGDFIKPTTRLVQMFGYAATKAKVFLDEEGLKRLLMGEELLTGLNIGKGYVILILGKEQILGLGFLINGRIRSQLRKKEFRNHKTAPDRGCAKAGSI